MDDTDTLEIRECEPGEAADAILALRVFVPGVLDGTAGEYPLRRSPPPPPDRVVESVTVSPDGRVTEVVTVRTVRMVSSAHACHADGVGPDGRGCGYGMMVSVEGRGPDAVAVSVSLHWTAPGGGRGEAAGEFEVPWLGAGGENLGDGVWVEGRITPVR